MRESYPVSSCPPNVGTGPHLLRKIVESFSFSAQITDSEVKDDVLIKHREEKMME